MCPVPLGLRQLPRIYLQQLPLGLLLAESDLSAALHRARKLRVGGEAGAAGARSGGCGCVGSSGGNRETASGEGQCALLDPDGLISHPDRPDPGAADRPLLRRDVLLVDHDIPPAGGDGLLLPHQDILLAAGLSGPELRNEHPVPLHLLQIHQTAPGSSQADRPHHQRDCAGLGYVNHLPADAALLQQDVPEALDPDRQCQQTHACQLSLRGHSDPGSTALLSRHFSNL